MSIEDPTPAGGGVSRPGWTPRPALPRRFFAKAHVEAGTAGYQLQLDGRRAKTPARRDLALPTAAAAAAVAEEWNGLGETIDPGLMPLTRLCNAAIDGVALTMEATAAEVAQYLRSDLLAYRAGEPDALVAAQAAAWDPVLDWTRAAFGGRFILAEGVLFVEQPPASLAAMDGALKAAIGVGAGAPFRLAALNVMTVLTGSALLALAVLHGRLDVAEAWAAAHVDEVFQEQRWGADAEALERRAARWRDMQAAARLAELAAA